jgi:hypothetical protein
VSPHNGAMLAARDIWELPGEAVEACRKYVEKN